MWFFSSPQIVFGDEALSYLEQIEGTRALIVTDPTLHRLGFGERVARHLHTAGIATQFFAEVEPEPSIQTVQRGAAVAAAYAPDWIVGLGGGSAIDAAKAILALYERPDLAPEAISPVAPLGLRRAKLIAIPTTSGTGSEATWALVLTDTVERRKLALASRELVPHLAIVDPALTRDLPAQLTADTGLDALTHAVEGYTSTWRNDFTDGLCLKACQLVFAYLARAVVDSGDLEAREHMANAATIAGLGFGNANTGLAHAMGHSLGGLFKQPHGRAVSLYLPYIVEYALNQEANMSSRRYGDLARIAGLTNDVDDQIAGRLLVDRLRTLQRSLGQPLAVAQMGIVRDEYFAAMERLCDFTEMDTQFFTAPRIPQRAELEQLFTCAYEGWPVEF
jgi:alcohol dehydrogenase class IV